MAEEVTLPPLLSTEKVSVFYYDEPVLYGVDFKVPDTGVTALLGPFRSGKSTFLRLFNRMNELQEGFSITGKVLFRGQDIYQAFESPEAIRRQIVYLSEKPRLFEQSIFDNVAFGLKIHGLKDKEQLMYAVQKALSKVQLWEHLRDSLNKKPHGLDLGHQQLLCLARLLALEPSVILMDEPTASLDHIATSHFEEIVFELGKTQSIVLATHDILQAGRMGNYVAFFYSGRLVEHGGVEQMFTNPKDSLTLRYLSGRL